MENNEEQVIDMNERVRISPRISRRTRALAKALYPVMGVTLEGLSFCWQRIWPER